MEQTQGDNSPKFTIRAERNEYSIVPGSSTDIRLFISNAGDAMDFVEIGIRGIPVSWATLSIRVVQLGPGQVQEITLTIQPPPPPQTQAGVFPLVVVAVSQADPKLTAQVEISLRVAVFEARGRIGVMMESIQFSVNPGASTQIPITLLNQGLEPDSFRLSVEGLPVNWISTQTPTTHLNPGEEREISLTIHPLQAPDSKAGRHSFQLKIISQMIPEDFVEVRCILTVAVYSEFRAGVQPDPSEVGAPVQLLIENIGNADQVFETNWQSAENALLFEVLTQVAPAAGTQPGSPPPSQYVPVTTPYSLRVPAGATGSLDFRAKQVNRPLFGGLRVYPYSVVVKPSGKSETAGVTVQGQMSGQAWLPVWVLPVLLVFCIGLACLFVVLNRQTNNQTASATLTAEAGISGAIAGTQTAAANMTAAVIAGQLDTDGDGVTDATEATNGTDPQKPDTDNDLLPDGKETAPCPNPLDPDTDKDGIIDGKDLEPCDPNNPAMTATAIAAIPTTVVPTTAVPTTAVPPTAVPPTAVPPTAVPPTAVQPTAVPPTAVPPTQAPPPATVTPPPIALPGFIAFVSDREGDLELYVENATNKSVGRLTNSPGIDTQPAISPDGKRLAFTTNRDGNNEIYLMNADGTNVANLSNNPADDQFPTWSPDGSKIAFSSSRDGNWEIYSVGTNGSALTNLTNNPADDQAPSWYNAGGILSGQVRIAFATNRDGNFEIYTMNQDGTNVVNITNNPASDTFPSVSFDGTTVAFVSDRDGNQDIFLLGMSSSAPANRTNNPAADLYPHWSPDNRWIAFASNRGNLDIYVMRVDGTNLMNFSNNPAGDDFPAWR